MGYICACRPSCHWFSYRFWKPHRAGEVLPKFCIDSFMFLFCREELVGAELEYLGDPDRLPRRCGSACTASPRHCTDPPWPR